MKFKKLLAAMREDYLRNIKYISIAVMLLCLAGAIRAFIEKDYYTFGLDLFLGALNSLGFVDDKNGFHDDFK